MTSEQDRLSLDRASTPIGDVLVVTRADGALAALEWAESAARLVRLLRRSRASEPEARTGPAPRGIRRALKRYFEGDLRALDSIPIAPEGTPFQRLVWSALRRIAPGETLAYGELSARIGRPGAARAVGLANARNPLALVVPCHRVVGADGALTGYAGGLVRKSWLLAHERRSAEHGVPAWAT
jgi:methylated-DNA-[protein]-cysteine S-methyltransferase